MRSGVYSETLGPSFQDADKVWLIRPQQDWVIEQCLNTATVPIEIYNSLTTLIHDVAKEAKPHDHIVIMSNRGSDTLHEKLVHALGSVPKAPL